MSPIYIIFITAVEFKLTVVRHAAQLTRILFIKVYVGAVVCLIEHLFLCAVVFRLGCRSGSSYFDATASGRVQQLGQVLLLASLLVELIVVVIDVAHGVAVRLEACLGGS